MNKKIVYLILAVLAGFLAGWLIFANATGSADTPAEAHDHSDTAGRFWTCSMHPQIMQPEPGQCPICGMDLIPAESDAEGLSLNELRMSPNAMALADIRTTVVGDGQMPGDNRITLSGKIGMNEEENAVQASYFDGRIERLDVNFEGQEIRRGQLLATIYAPELIAAQQELLTAAGLRESQPALYQAVRNKLKLWKLSEEQINTIETSGKVTEYFPIYATVSGTVSAKLAAQGDYVKQGEPLLKVSNLNTVWAEFDAYENQIAAFRVGQRIEMVSNAYPGKVFDAAISFIDPVLDTRTRTVKVRANLANREGLLKPGMFVTGTVEGMAKDNDAGISIPASAVLWTGERSVVYLKTRPGEPVFQMQEIVLGPRIGDEFSVVSGLEAGQEIVTHGTFTVDAAAQLQGKKSMMGPEGGAVPSGHRGHGSMSGETPGKTGVSAGAAQVYGEALKAYLRLKEALVSGQDAQAAEWAREGGSGLSALSDSDGLAKLNTAFRTVAEATDLEGRREAFIALSGEMIRVGSGLEHSDNRLYVQYCPMANSGKGASWISDREEIRNPYYGDAMLTCGEVTATWEP